jgi:hypothetical protein
MTRNLNQRLIALKKVGGTETLHVLPRGKRAQVIASILSEDPIKEKSKKAAAVFAFKSMVEKGDAVRAKKIARKYSFGHDECVEVVSKKIDKLRAESEEGQSNLASDFEILFRLEGYQDVAAKFGDTLSDRLEVAFEKLRQADYPFTHKIFTGILEDGKRLGVTLHEKDAAAGLFACWLKRGSLEDALDVAGEYLMENGKVIPAAEEMVMEETGAFLMRTGKGALERIAKSVKGKGKEFFGLMQDAAHHEISSLNYTDLEKCEALYSIAQLLEMRDEMMDLGAFLVNAYTSIADSQPDKFPGHYYKAAEIAAKLGMDEEMDEAVAKYLATCDELGANNPEYFEKGMFAAMHFGFDHHFEEFAEKAFYGHLAAGRLEKAEFIADKSGMKDLHLHVTHIIRRSEL